MKTNYWLILGAMLSTSLLAQQATNPAPAAPIADARGCAGASAGARAGENQRARRQGRQARRPPRQAAKAPAKKAVARSQAPTPELRTTPLVPGPAIVVASNVNVRGQAKLKSEVVTRLTKGADGDRARRDRAE